MIRKFAICVAAALMLLPFAARAQYKEPKAFITFQGGLAFSLNENFQAFFDNKCVNQLFQGCGAFSVGTYFNRRYGIRASVEYSMNKSAGNYQENHGQFNPYDFKSVIGFADFIVNCGDVSRLKAFNCRVFAGLGYAHSFKFNLDPKMISWYKVNDPNNCFGVRGGFILEYLTRVGIGFFFEGCFEMFTDRYNGVDPSNSSDGKLGFPFDYKLNNSLGVAFHF